MRWQGETEGRRAGCEMAGRNCTFRASGFVTFSIYYWGWGGYSGHKKNKNVVWFGDVSKETMLGRKTQIGEKH